MAEGDSANFNDYHMVLLDSLEELPEQVGDEIDQVLIALVLWEHFPFPKQGSEEIES